MLRNPNPIAHLAHALTGLSPCGLLDLVEGDDVEDSARASYPCEPLRASLHSAPTTVRCNDGATSRHMIGFKPRQTGGLRGQLVPKCGTQS